MTAWTDPIRFDELVEEYRILGEHQKVRRNSANDFDLPTGWVFSTGGYRTVDGKRDWYSLWVKPRPEAVAPAEPSMIGGRVNHLDLAVSFDRTVCRRVAGDRHMIGQAVGGPVTDLPADVLALLHWTPPATRTPETSTQEGSDAPQG